MLNTNLKFREDTDKYIVMGVKDFMRFVKNEMPLFKESEHEWNIEWYHEEKDLYRVFYK